MRRYFNPRLLEIISALSVFYSFLSFIALVLLNTIIDIQFRIDITILIGYIAISSISFLVIAILRRLIIIGRVKTGKNSVLNISKYLYLEFLSALIVLLIFYPNISSFSLDVGKMWAPLFAGIGLSFVLATGILAKGNRTEIEKIRNNLWSKK